MTKYVFLYKIKIYLLAVHKHCIAMLKLWCQPIFTISTNQLTCYMTALALKIKGKSYPKNL